MSTVLEKSLTIPQYFLDCYEAVKWELQSVLDQLPSPQSRESFVQLRSIMTYALLSLDEVNDRWHRYISRPSPIIYCVDRARSNQELGQGSPQIPLLRPVILVKSLDVRCLQGISEEKGAIQKILQVLEPRLLDVAAFFQKIENDKAKSI